MVTRGYVQILSLRIATQVKYSLNARLRKTHSPKYSYNPPVYIQYAKVPHPFIPRIKTLTRTLINLFYAMYTLYARTHS